MIIENLSTLKIYNLTQEQYERKLANGEIDQTALYFTDEEDADIFATIEQLKGKADKEHSHDDTYYTESEVDEKINTINASVADVKSYADGVGAATLDTAQTYTDNALTQKTQVQIIAPDNTETLSTLQIHKLTQKEYDEKLASGEIDENALYLTPDVSIYATLEDIENKSDIGHTHNDIYYTESEIDEKIDVINTSVAQKSQVQIITWEEDD